MSKLPLLLLPLAACATVITPYVNPTLGLSSAFPYPVEQRNRGGHVTLAATNASDTVSYQIAVIPLTDTTLVTKSTEKILSDAIGGAVREADGELLSSKDISLDGFPGKQFEIKSGVAIANCRMYVAGRRMYLVMVIAPPYASLPMDANAFHAAFKLIDPLRPSP